MIRHTSPRPPGYTAYKTDGCRCYQCSNAVATYNRDRDRAILNGTWQPFVPAQPVRDHITMLATHGIGWRRTSHLAGLSTGTISKLLYGVPKHNRPPSSKVRAETAHRILAVRPTVDAAADHAVIDATGYNRRLQALVALGYPHAFLAAQLGIQPSNFHLSRPRVLALHHRAARALYDQLWNQNPLAGGVSAHSANRALNYAQRHQWAPPLAWDDDTIDDPAATPNLGEKTLRQDALAEDAEFIARTTGADRTAIAKRLGVSRNYLEKTLERAAAAA
jgi:hypothetical protein